MTNLELLVVGFLSLLLAGTASFLTASHNARWEAKYSVHAEYIEPTEWAQMGLKGTFSGDDL